MTPGPPADSAAGRAASPPAVQDAPEPGSAVVRVRRPAAPPSASDLAERDAFQRLASGSLRAVRASAEAWRNGLAAFITLVTTAVIITGHGAAHELAVGWRIAVSVLVAGGLLLAVSGLWQALAAQAGGKPDVRTLAKIHSEYGSIAALEVAQAASAAAQLARARYLVAAAIVLLLSGTVGTWWAPKTQPEPPAYLQITYGEKVVCGRLESGDGGQLRIRVKGTHQRTVVTLAEITNVEVVANCP